MKILVIHGPNLHLLGQREEDIYGKDRLEQINEELKELAKKNNIELDIIQTNCEGKIVDVISSAINKYDGIIINPAAYTHTSIAIHDAIKAVNIPTIEVHISNIYKREKMRHFSYIAKAAEGQITGLGKYSYILALEYFIKKKSNK